MKDWVTAPGIYTMSAEAYHADPCPAPSLSSSIARELLASSPKHAWWAHARLNPAYEPEHKTAFDIGTAAHALLLEGEAGCLVVEAADWRTKDAKDQKAAAYLAGRVPLLAHQWQDVRDMVEAARRQLAKHEDRPEPLTAGKPEQVLIWQEGVIWCRARLDWLHDDHRVIDDYKSTGATANPDVWARRTVYGMGYDVQDAFYRRGLKAVVGIDAAFRFIVQETFKPHALAVVGLGPEAAALADRKVSYAIDLWGDCLERGTFPGYPTRTCWAELPGWEETQWLAREARESWARGVDDDGRPVGELLNRE